MSRIDAILATALAAATLTIGLYFAPREFQGGFVDMAHDGYLLHWRDEPLTEGDLFVARELFEGGIQIGFLNRGRWSACVTIIRQGPFEAVFQLQKKSLYELVVANSIQSEAMNRMSHRAMVNRFRIEAGWIRAARPTSTG